MAEASPSKQRKKSEADISSESTSDDKDKDLFLKLKEEGNRLYKAEDFEGALLKYEEALNATSDLASKNTVRHNRGMAFQRLGKLSEAIEEYTTVLNLDPKYLKVRRRRAEVYKDTKEFEKALDDLKEAHFQELNEKKAFFGPTQTLTQVVLDAYTEHEVARRYKSKKDWKPSKIFIETYLRGFHNDPVSKWWRTLKDTPFEFVIETNDSLSGFLAALRELSKRKYDKIIDLCTDELKSQTQYMYEAYLLRATFYFLWSNEAGSLEDLKKIVEANTENVSNKLKSSAYLKLGMQIKQHPCQSSEIYEAYLQAETLWPENVDIYVHGALSLIDAAKAVEARELLDKGACCTELSPLFKVLDYSISFAIHIADEEQRTLNLRKLKEMEPEFDIPECHEVYSQAFILRGDWKIVDEQFNKAIEKSGGDPVFHVKKILSYQLMHNDPARTQDELQNLLKKFPNHGLTLYHIGMLSIQRGNPHEGFQFMQKSVDCSESVHEIRDRFRSMQQIKFQGELYSRLRSGPGPSSDFNDAVHYLRDKLQTMSAL